jgi:hypothetical protein
MSNYNGRANGVQHQLTADEQAATYEQYTPPTQQENFQEIPPRRLCRA